MNQGDRYIDSKIKDRTSVARMNRACEMARHFEDMRRDDVINQSNINIWISSLLVGDGKNKYISPNEEMYKDLETFAGMSIFRCQAEDMVRWSKMQDYEDFDIEMVNRMLKLR